MRHFIALQLVKLARLITAIAHRVDDDFTGKTLYVPADPQNEIRAFELKVIKRLPDGKWHVKLTGSDCYGYSHEYLKKLRVMS
jgi:hypothetical protein